MNNVPPDNLPVEPLPEEPAPQQAPEKEKESPLVPLGEPMFRNAKSPGEELEEESDNKKKWLIIGGVILGVIVISLVIFLTLRSAFKDAPGETGSTATSTQGAPAGGGFNIFSLFGFGGGQATPPAQSGGASTGGGTPPPPEPAPDIPPDQIPFGFKLADLSRYFGKVSVGGVDHPDLNSVSEGNTFAKIELNFDVSEGEKVNITGWKIQTNIGSVLLPRGSSILSPTNFSNTENITVQRGDNVKIYFNKAPMPINFRLNKCIGYLNASHFKPELPNECPQVYETRSELSSYPAQCQDYILSLGSCEGPLTKFPDFSDSKCDPLLRRADYAGCFKDHNKDGDFLKSEWRVWLGRDGQEYVHILDPNHDRILIFDLRGKLVAENFY